MPDIMRARLWNTLHYFHLKLRDKEPDDFGDTWAVHNDDECRLNDILFYMWDRFFKLPFDSMPYSIDNVIEKIRGLYSRLPWHRVYDFFEVLADCECQMTEDRERSVTYAEYASHFRLGVNSVLKEENAAYRFIGAQIAEITAEEEIREIEAALAQPGLLSNVGTHIATSLRLLSNREKPDFRNAIKEAISAVEAATMVITGKSKATLGDALNALAASHSLHGALRSAFSSLYGYTSDSDGIRHALMEESNVDYDDAKFMLVACSAFSNYLISKTSSTSSTLLQQSRQVRSCVAHGLSCTRRDVLIGRPNDYSGNDMPAVLRSVRTDHVGSLLRPQSLIDSFLRRARREIGDEELHRQEDVTIREVVAKQEAHGISFVTDGEFRRLNWQVSFSEVLGWDLWEISWKGFLKNPRNIAPSETPNTKGEDAVVSFRSPATARLKLKQSFPLGELKFLKSVAKAPAKITLMGPDRVCQMCDIEGSRAVYAGADAFLADVVAVQRQMVDELVANGCDYIQIDEPSYTGYVDPPTLARLKAKGEDPMANLRRAIEADNAVIAGVKGRAVTGLHICRGNRASMWHREGKYDAIAEALFGGLKYDRLLLEYDTARAGGFEPLRFVPKGVVAVLGLVTTKTGRVETVDELKRRIDDAARFLPLEQLALSPQCGFASGIAGNMLSEDEQWRKMDVIRETARRVWG